MPLICLNVQLLLVTKVVVKRIGKSSLSNFSQYYSTAEDTKGIYKMTYWVTGKTVVFKVLRKWLKMKYLEWVEIELVG